MPHKRAKRSIREQDRSQKGTDLAPNRSKDALSSEPLPKSFARAINAAQVRADFRAKRKLGKGEGEDGPKKAKRRKVEGSVGEAKIRPGETLAHFNKRIETDMRPLVRSAVQSSLATVRAERKKSSSDPTASSTPSKTAKSTKSSASTAPKSTSNSKSKPQFQDDDDAPAPVDKHASRPKEFARTSSAAPRRLNDIALAPPELSAHTRKAAPKTTSSKSSSVLSPAQQLQMAAAREAAVAHYRKLKAARRAAGGGDGGERGGGAMEEGEE
ncbi:hypothetical protein B0H13DRAFT_1707238 [Mycena leptocephala]|nr:hypothetical protein B0H13DRAFT_1707238 [Mycena leptocephala]